MKVTALAGWFGSKRTLSPLIVSQLGPHKAYIEPFSGSMAVLLAKQPCSFEIANDLHGDLTNLAWTIQHEWEGPHLYRQLRRTLFDEATFTFARERINMLPLAESPLQVNEQTAERAYWYFVLCWMGRSGVLGTKDYNNVFTVRYTTNGGNQATRFSSAVDSIPDWRKRLRNVTITRRCGLELLEKTPDQKGLSIYVDPPYLQKGAEYEHDFSPIDHACLASILDKFREARVVVSYYRHHQLESLYPSSRWTWIDATRTKNMSVQGRRGAVAKQAEEVLLVNGPRYLSGAAEGLFVEGEAS